MGRCCEERSDEGDVCCKIVEKTHTVGAGEGVYAKPTTKHKTLGKSEQRWFALKLIFLKISQNLCTKCKDNVFRIIEICINIYIY